MKVRPGRVEAGYTLFGLNRIYYLDADGGADLSFFAGNPRPGLHYVRVENNGKFLRLLAGLDKAAAQKLAAVVAERSGMDAKAMRSDQSLQETEI